MKISFPYMGCVTGYKRIFEKLGHEVIMPPKPTERTFELGVKYSPEFICFPFKIMLGTYFEVIEKGAEVIVSSAGNGPCRAGYYPEIHEMILRQEGHSVPVISFDSIFDYPKKFFEKLKLITNKTPVHKIIGTVMFGFSIICHMEALDKKLKKLRAHETEKGAFNKAWAEIVNIFDSCNTLRDLRRARRESENILKNIPMDTVCDGEKIKVGIVGEIYVAMESSCNMDIEQRLNDMGVESENAQYISYWLKHNIVPFNTKRDKVSKLMKKAEKYSAINCGGHDKENIGAIIDFAERGFDAVIHLMPFSCLPELVTRSIIPALSEDLRMPILSVSMDEQTGTANMQTRLEAFIELVISKKRAKKISDIPAPAIKETKRFPEILQPETGSIYVNIASALENSKSMSGAK